MIGNPTHGNGSFGWFHVLRAASKLQRRVMLCVCVHVCVGVLGRFAWRISNRFDIRRTALLLG
jgi:hypothetical protein